MSVEIAWLSMALAGGNGARHLQGPAGQAAGARIHAGRSVALVVGVALMAIGLGSRSAGRLAVVAT